MEGVIATGCDFLDELLEGGYEPDVVTTVFGPSGSGKTSICMCAAIARAAEKKVIYVDSEGGFSAARFRQLCRDPERVIQRMVFLKPASFKEQEDVFERLPRLISDKIGLVIVDTISMLYRLELGKEDDVKTVNRALGAQMGQLMKIARKKMIPVIATTQVYSSFEEKNKVNLVGGDIVRYSSKCLIELQVIDSYKRAILKKHRSLPEKEIDFEIKQDGLYKREKTGERKGRSSGAIRLF
ncbi:DNA repair and recombination protein RadB [Candidatus Woesearchaeota archaeon CG10_big_fil_rev_8_21_14_0_10_47_5]|nr:MAG: DNA repair and recombination protein RadB [Candidatus Woesearchaeota archaeon CG1_02_47_18]PIN72651.1 MAG: DNA repair and recombination protein RadB [Candidatus Woesearchaeota archaeon CG10_big_fil_rev_8_21_14_0_10_47_5]HII29606.1 DNA repair and recombination protein RadB [Candidatus Woesearchaeota archaeon]